MGMLIKNIKTFTKHLYKNKLYTFITVFGFAVSLAFVILLSIYIKNVQSINKKQLNKERIYRIRSEHFSNFAPPVGSWVQSKVPDVESFCRIKEMNGIIERDETEKININYLLADSTFFKMFTFKLLEGNYSNILKGYNSIVISRKFANKIFGDESPIGKELKLNIEHTVIVSGVVDDLSKVSCFKDFDVIVNFRFLAELWDWENMEEDFGNNSFDLYFLEKNNADLPSKSQQILEFFKKDFWLYKNGRNKEVIFETLDEAYYSKFYGNGINQNSHEIINVFIAIVFLILLLAIINYLNLTIAQAGSRVKEIAIKKLFGNSRKNLILQLIIESVLLCSIAFGFAIIFSFLAAPLFNKLLGAKIDLAQEFIKLNIIVALIFILIIAFVSGIFPALVITKLKAIDVIKGSFRMKSKTTYSKIFIVFQYIVVIVLIIATIVISKQTNFLIDYDLGYNTNNIIRLDNTIKPPQKETLRDLFLKISGVKKVAFVAGDPIDGGNNQSFTYLDKAFSFQEFIVDSSFFEMMKIKSTPTGAAYSKQGYWFNKTAVKELELDSLPTHFGSGNDLIPILGVFDDIHFRSLHLQIGMLRIKLMRKNDNPWNILIQIEGKNKYGTLSKIKKEYLKFNKGTPFEMEFIEDRIKSNYESEENILEFISYFALLSIIISVMGIFAMSVFYNQLKIKEIGIRKVNGATVFEIIKMLNMNFIKWVLIAFILAVPIAYYAMSKWLEGFAYKIKLSWWIFILAGGFALLLALVTVSWNTFSAARQNPVESLKYE